ncbi:type VII toxin-antitoxin system MntA family adenylyltransferase antitoxin [Arhodomonas sp. SL1]|uniref:type VII toxin-antitoxin system MntA family adenylyltransferase antitoxin n=1 Tax=Arhodomonas sp. SL1 TaxID=3425691 RepID=UPI003F8819B9
MSADGRSLTTAELALIRSRLQEAVPGLMAIYLFGSYAQGNARADSDADLAILARESVPPLRRFELAEELAMALGRDVDLVDLRAASAVLRSQIVAYGTPIYRSDDPDVEAFEDFVYADYARLNEERAGILEDIRARGSVYGR